MQRFNSNLHRSCNSIAATYTHTFTDKEGGIRLLDWPSTVPCFILATAVPLAQRLVQPAAPFDLLLLLKRSQNYK